LRAAAPTTLHIDLRADLSAGQIREKLTRAKTSDSLSSTLRKALGLSHAAIALLYENGRAPRDPKTLAAYIKSLPIKVGGPDGMERAISTAGGVAWEAVDEKLRLNAVPDTAVAGEMLDWEAPTGGYLLQASFATG